MADRWMITAFILSIASNVAYAILDLFIQKLQNFEHLPAAQLIYIRMVGQTTIPYFHRKKSNDTDSSREGPYSFRCPGCITLGPRTLHLDRPRSVICFGFGLFPLSFHALAVFSYLLISLYPRASLSSVSDPSQSPFSVISFSLNHSRRRRYGVAVSLLNLPSRKLNTCSHLDARSSTHRIPSAPRCSRASCR